MKKILSIALFIFALQIQAQKSVVFYNNTANTVTIQDLVTRTNSYSYPEYHSKPSQSINIPPYSTYKLQNAANATRFPFYSPTSVPLINTWERVNATGSAGNVASTAAWVAGSTQVFYWIQISMGTTSKKIGVLQSGSPLSLTSNGWTASYTQLGTAVAPEYIITIQ